MLNNVFGYKNKAIPFLKLYLGIALFYTVFGDLNFLFL